MRARISSGPDSPVIRMRTTWRSPARKRKRARPVPASGRRPRRSRRASRRPHSARVRRRARHRLRCRPRWSLPHAGRPARRFAATSRAASITHRTAGITPAATAHRCLQTKQKHLHLHLTHKHLCAVAAGVIPAVRCVIEAALDVAAKRRAGRPAYGRLQRGRHRRRCRARRLTRAECGRRDARRLLRGRRPEAGTGRARLRFLAGERHVVRIRMTGESGPDEMRARIGPVSRDAGDQAAIVI